MISLLARSSPDRAVQFRTLEDLTIHGFHVKIPTDANEEMNKSVTVKPPGELLPWR